MGGHLCAKNLPTRVALGLWVMSLPAQAESIKLEVCSREPLSCSHLASWERAPERLVRADGQGRNPRETQSPNKVEACPGLRSQAAAVSFW